MPTLYIIRGLPGSGKSTYAANLIQDKHLAAKDWWEADMFFHCGPSYNFDSSLLPIAHNWCFSNVFKSLFEGNDTIVSNTFTEEWEWSKYLDITNKLPDISIEFIELKTQFKSIHNVPEETIWKMKYRWDLSPKGYPLTIITE